MTVAEPDLSISKRVRLGIVIPAYNEEESVGVVVKRCLAATRSFESCRVIICDNGSLDDTGTKAAEAGAEVIRVETRGYGAACNGGIAHLADWPDIYVFLDADGSSRPEEIASLTKDVVGGGVDLAIGRRPPLSPMSAPQRWGTWLAVKGVNLLWGSDFSDMGPFRCITRESLRRLGMRDKTWGWTIEMQILALIKGLRVKEVPVAWEERVAGTSKISGTLTGVAKAGFRILWTIARYGVQYRTRCLIRPQNRQAPSPPL